jgi:NAD-dependent SIR2 family protein deacetylase
MTEKPTTSTRDLCGLLQGRRIVVLAGAGCSTESGIPDYRGAETAKLNRKPMQYQEFVRSHENRVRYWSRSMVGWQRMANALPNAGHHALAALEQRGIVAGIITQNVDGLHHAAGSRRVIELHGSLAQVRCLECDATSSRSAFQDRLRDANPSWAAAIPSHKTQLAPDGDTDIAPVDPGMFVVPACTACGGTIKPDVVFFGENVPRTRVDAAWQMLDEGDVLLVAGSSLTVYSGRRFIYRAAERGTPVAIINQGPTRADDLAAVKVDGRTGEILPSLVSELSASHT